MINIYNKKYYYIENELKDYYLLLLKLNNKNIDKITKRRDDIYIIINDVIYKEYSYNNIHHILKDINNNNNKCYISSHFYNCRQNYDTIEEALTDIKNNNMDEVPCHSYRLSVQTIKNI